MGDAGGEPEEHGSVELLGQLIGQLGVGEALGGVAGLKHGNLGGNGVAPGILLVLGGVHPRIVGDGADHARVDADI